MRLVAVVAVSLAFLVLTIVLDSENINPKCGKGRREMWITTFPLLSLMIILNSSKKSCRGFGKPSRQ